MVLNVTMNIKHSGITLVSFTDSFYDNHYIAVPYSSIDSKGVLSAPSLPMLCAPSLSMLCAPLLSMIGRKVWQINSFRAFGKIKFGELTVQPIDYLL